MHRFPLLLLLPLLVGNSLAAPAPAPITRDEDVLVESAAAGHPGGHLTVALRAEPNTLNPVLALDQPSRDVIRMMSGDLIHIHAVTQLPATALAKSWSKSGDGLRYRLNLRHGIRFSDGKPFDADDVVFTFNVHLDDAVHSAQHDLLIVGGTPVQVRKVDRYTVEFTLARPYAAAERLFDGFAILPRHLLEKPWKEGHLAQSWPLAVNPSEIAGLGPFRLKVYVPGQRVVLERNPYYWKRDRKGVRLPYLDELTFLFVPDEDAQILRFRQGEIDILGRVSADNFDALLKSPLAATSSFRDLGASLEDDFLFFNMGPDQPDTAPATLRKRNWFRQTAFRQAISKAIDRDAITRLAYHGRATPLSGFVTPANRLWRGGPAGRPARSLQSADVLLKRAGFTTRADGVRVDAAGIPVEFTIISSASNAQRLKMAAMIQEDLADLGIRVQVVPMEFRALLDRVFKTRDFDAVLFAFGGGDVDPNSHMPVLLSNGSSHVWDLDDKAKPAPWQGEIDQLMNDQLSTLDAKKRKGEFDRVQAIVATELPIVPLVSPNVLAGASNRVGGFDPAILDNVTLWNADQLFVK